MTVDHAEILDELSRHYDALMKQAARETSAYLRKILRERAFEVRVCAALVQVVVSREMLRQKAVKK